ncbi:MAG: ornithine cyclodeaminase family protein [Alphaproteobacteria bacterium]|nr:ornithine cyclodeaminase family protein [Alphaproteobacteria bacterium]
MTEILYLSGADLERLGIGLAELVPVLEAAFRLKAAGLTIMPPKIFFHRGGARFYSAMVSWAPGLGYAGCKWQSGDPANAARGLAYIQGLLVITRDEDGRPVAIMDAKWVTACRTAAASALAAKHLARKGAARLAVLGCGLQGRKHLEALSGVLENVRECCAYDILPEREAAFAEECDGRWGVRVRPAGSAEAAVREADVIVTAGPIEQHRRPTLVPEWLARGSLTIAIDYDSYVSDGAIAAADLVLTDDRAQIEDARRHENKFLGVTRIDAELAELLSSGQGRRTSDGQRILLFNLGIALEDLATGLEALQRARAMGIGTKLPA